VPFFLAAKYYMENMGLQFFSGYTLVDITPTHVIRSANPDDVQRNQQRNWETVLQCMSLRTQPLHIKEPTVYREVPTDMINFGDYFQGNQTIWSWSWAIEKNGVYDLPNRSMGGLLQDFEQVPIITGLEETGRFMLPIFYPYGAIKNVYFVQQDQ
jgi:hypothetical protein